ncbi:adenylyltransferase/cytidyltransferase family protein [Schaalia sp. 19OD2882]|uniref:adenylyltransferase/cytidyltransferase family protein n=1 Tax=Schaalia sp. 19OD2882 TaxID=2794089 RepID=UPI001C1EC15A|nr:adenylyltransferase/cytidyltransferase family protein [Schaalia sp. 19OD2882]QWW19178.1 adenylyltransferase/cytidyltransferase family protein [Schaalia sp. 19OD2882]
MTSRHTIDAPVALAPARRVTGYVPGGFDMLHVGHLNILRAARARCDRLVVGVATDESLRRMKGKDPVIPLKERCELLAALRFVDAVVVDLDQDKRVAWRLQPFDVLFKGDDWKDTPKGERLEAELAEVGARVVYLPYTASTSSTMLRRFLSPDEVEAELGEGLAVTK